MRRESGKMGEWEELDGWEAWGEQYVHDNIKAISIARVLR